MARETVRTCPRCGNVYPVYVARCPDDGTMLRGAEGPAPPEPESKTIAGTTIDGRYYVGQLIGKGSMGRVYRGNQLSIGRPVALKVLRKDYTNDESVRERFLREAKLVSKFTHPNIVRMIDFGETSEDRLYLVLELVDGVPLQRVVRGHSTDLSLVLEIASQLAGPLVEAHDAGVTHRDLKPDNIFLTRGPDGGLSLKVLDFGIARVEQATGGERAADLTLQGHVFGTPEYMSPEQARGETVGPATDLYAVGVIMYELLAGVLPIMGDSQVETMSLQVTSTAVPLGEVADVPESVGALVHELLEKDPEKRLSDPRELKRRIEAIRKEEGIWPLGELPEGDLGFVLEHEFVGPSPPIETVEPPPTSSLPRVSQPPTWFPRVLAAIALMLAVAVGYVIASW